MADMKNTRLELCNRIRMEAEHTEDTGFPLDVFPQTIQSIILDMAKYENYKTEFIATSMLSAVSTALGGTYRIRIKGDWQSNGALYVIMVGRPGLGKPVIYPVYVLDALSVGHAALVCHCCHMVLTCICL